MVVLGLVVVAVGASSRAGGAARSGSRSAAVGMAATSFMRTWQDFDLIQLVILPLFLFSAHVLPDRHLPAGRCSVRPSSRRCTRAST